MKLIMENWREYVEEDIDSKFKDLFEHKIDQNCNKVQETSLTEVEVSIASMYAGWEGVAIVLIPALAPVVLNPITLTIATGAGLRFKPIRKFLFWIFKKFIGEDNIQKISETTTAIIDKMVESSDGALDKASAIQLYGKIAVWIFKDEQFRSKLKEMFHALKERDGQRVQSLNKELDEIVQDIIQNEILETSKMTDTDPLDSPGDGDQLAHLDACVEIDGQTICAKE